VLNIPYRRVFPLATALRDVFWQKASLIAVAIAMNIALITTIQE